MKRPLKRLVRLGGLGPLLLSALLAACGGLSSVTSGPRITPVPTVTVPHQAARLVQYCVDDTGSYPHYDFQQANGLVATSLPATVRANSDGLTLYATLITSNTFDPSNSLAPFIVPGVPNYPALPTPEPTPAQANPVSYSATATTVANDENAAIASYNGQVAALNTQIQTARTQVGSDAKRLSSWNPAVDSRATSVWGCLQLARQRFTGQSATKQLIIASDMQNNTGVDYTADFESSQALKGVAIRVIFYVCQNAGSCQSLEDSWKQIFTGSGASSVTFDDPSQSQGITNLLGGA
jgi:hypothetical protein